MKTLPAGIPHRREAFSLVELLSVIAIVCILAALVSVAFSALNGAGQVNRAVSNLVGTLELARAHAMANNTYVRVALGSLDSNNDKNPTLGVFVFYSTDGSKTESLSQQGSWRLVGKPLLLENFAVDDALCPGGGTVQTQFPSDSDISPVAYKYGQLNLTLDAFIQFAPSGQASVMANEPARSIEIGVDQLPAAGTNPFVIRLSGVTGSVAALRKGEGI